MNAKILLVSALACCLTGFTSCDDDDDNYMPDNVVEKAFEVKYPNAERVSWETKGGYMVADFHQGNIEAEAWFDRMGDWLMTETDLPYASLPVEVKNSFEKGAYADWKVDDVDVLERKGAAIVYILEVEKGKEEYDLHYEQNGILIKEVADSDNEGYLPEVFPEEIIKVIQQKYPNATILEIENEENGMEIDVIHEGVHKEIHFARTGSWIYTEWEILRSQVPAVIMDALKASEYGAYPIDDIHVVEREGNLFYQFELEVGDKDIHVLFNGNGTIVK